MADGVLAPYPWLQFFDGTSTTYPNARLSTYVAGTSTPLSVYTSAALDVAHSNPVVAASTGIFAPIYIGSSSSYKFVLADEDSVILRTADNIQSANYFQNNFGSVMSAGSRNVTGGYVLLVTDRTVTVASSGATTFNLLASSSFTSDVTVKNMLAGTVVVTCNGAETIDGSLASFTLEAAGTPVFPAVTLRPITGGWLIVNSHRVA